MRSKRWLVPTLAVTAPLLGGFFTRVAHDIAELAPQARVLEIGSGRAGWPQRWPWSHPGSG
jgi:hypothetical protein